nr:AraC family transcriptional regulator [Paraburkholderia sp. Tr-20389]
MLGPNLPHAWQSRATLKGPRHQALVCWFTEPWITALIDHSPELRPVHGLLVEAGRGISFSSTASANIRTRLQALVGAPPARHWLGLLEILLELCGDIERSTLASNEIKPVGGARERTRLTRVLDWLNEHYTEQVALDSLAEIAHLSTSQLQRLFKRSTRLSVSEYIMQRRIGHACALLAQGELPVAQVGARVGYSDPTYFARQFKAMKGCSPTEYRRLFCPK